jgi:hypothetical protein
VTPTSNPSRLVMTSWAFLAISGNELIRGTLSKFRISSWIARRFFRFFAVASKNTFLRSQPLAYQ